MTNFFESSLEKIARILARQYNIDVIFEGNQASTDGKKIYLPFFKNLTPELKSDLNGFLDHETAHCKFTDMPAYRAIKKRFVRELTNAAEDIRIEREMVKEFPGTVYHLEPLREKFRGEHRKVWREIPAIPRIILNVQWMMEGQAAIVDEDIERYIDVIKESVAKLSTCTSTQEVIQVCEEIAEKVEDTRKEEKEEEKKKKKGEKSEGEGEESDDEGDGDEDKDGEEMDAMMKEKTGEVAPGKSKFDKFSPDFEKMMNEKLKDHIEKETKEDSKKKKSDIETDATRTFSKEKISIPATTRFDTVTDHTGKGDGRKYQALKDQVRPLVAPIKTQLERVLKTKENARWNHEKEDGKLNSRSLARLAHDKTYRTPFKKYTKTETNNVAVEVLVDMSGSMSGKMETAKMATIAISEALRELDISFEVTGFHSKPDTDVAKFAEGISDATRFNRRREKLDLHVFKSFDSGNMTGIEKLFVGQQNPDGECVKWAAKRLELRTEKRKILLVLSDGAPCTGEGSGDVLNSDLKTKVLQIEKSGIECVGIGIQTDAVKHFYKNHVIINDIKKLPTEVMGKLSKIIQE